MPRGRKVVRRIGNVVISTTKRKAYRKRKGARQTSFWGQ